LTGNYNGRQWPTRGAHLRKVEFRQGPWSAPELLPPSINATGSTFSPSIAGDGSLYFMRPVPEGGEFHLFRSQWKDQRYLSPIQLRFSQLPQGDYDPAVAADERFIIFSSPGPPASNGSDLFITRKTLSGWSTREDLRQSLSPDVYGIEARLSPDGKTLFFTNNHDPNGNEAAGNTRHTWSIKLP
jgi:WD40-like Beta Propeller Repeat